MGPLANLARAPLVVCDTGHNVGGWEYLAPQIKAQPCRQLRMVFGMVDDKDIDAVLVMLPQTAVYYSRKPTTIAPSQPRQLRRKPCLTASKANLSTPFPRPIEKHWQMPMTTTSSLWAVAATSWPTFFPASDSTPFQRRFSLHHPVFPLSASHSPSLTAPKAISDTLICGF